MPDLVGLLRRRIQRNDSFDSFKVNQFGPLTNYPTGCALHRGRPKVIILAARYSGTITMSSARADASHVECLLESIAFIGSTSTQPAELYYLASPGAKAKRITDFNHDFTALDLGRIDTFEWKGQDGFAEDGTLVYPPNFSRDKKYPLVVYLHGEPQFAASVTEIDPFLQLFASHGYIVFAPNYLGTDNLGNACERAAVNDYGVGPGRSVMAGISALEKQGFIDESRIGVFGWSWGGYMTSWLIGHYHIWKAAVAGAAVNSLTDWYTLTDVNVTEGFMFGGSP